VKSQRPGENPVRSRQAGHGLSASGALCIVFNLLSHGGKLIFLIRQR